MTVAPIDKYDAPLAAARLGGNRFHLMAKPGGSTCNLRCDYCFYLAKPRLPGGPRPTRMSDETLEAFIQKQLAAFDTGPVVFSWQGGEPSLRGIPFFRRVLEFQRRHARPGQRVENDIQTNGTLLDDEWCEFLAENRFLVGLSMDGPPEIHDAHRVTNCGGPTSRAVIETAKRLHRHRVPFNTLTCVHRDNARRPLDVYRFLRNDIGSLRMQFIPIVEHRDFERVAPGRWNPTELPRAGAPDSRSIVTPWSVDPDDWGYFLIRIFDRWITNDAGRIFVSIFEDLVAQRAGLPAQNCTSAELCGKCLAIEADGGVYACDHFVYPEFYRGNILSDDLVDLVFSREQVKFAYAKSETLPRACRRCEYLRVCWGECPKNRLLRTADGEPGLNWLCAGYRAFYEHAMPAIDRLAADVKRRLHLE